jgi:hypothetical protein
MTPERRSLNIFESMFFLRNVGPIVGSVTLQGRVDVEVMDRAARLLQRDYPVMRSWLHRSGEHIDLVSSDEGPGLVVSASSGDVLEGELNIALGPDRPASRISLSQTAGAAVLSLSADHSAGDGVLVMYLLHRLLAYYTDLLRGQVPAPTGKPLFEGTLEEALLAAYEPLPLPPPDTADPPLTLGVDAIAPGAAGLRNLSFGQAETTALVAAARESGISLTSLLSGALACAVRAQFPADAGSQPVTLAIPVNLRPRLVPAVPPDAQFVCASLLMCTTRVGVGERPAEVGGRVGAQMHASLERNDIQHRLVAQRLSGRQAPFPALSFILSNLGTVEDYVVPDGLQVSGTRFASTSRGPVPTLYVMTAGGRLSLELIYDEAFYRTDVIDSVIGHLEASLSASLQKVSL